MKEIRITTVIKIFSLPILIYGLFIAIRIAGHQPAAEAEPGDFITACNFLFGASVAYFVVAVNLLTADRGEPAPVLWWWLMSALLILLAVDEVYMVHEYLGHQFGINDTKVLLAYGGLLGALLLARFSRMINVPTLLFLGLFATLSIIALVSDYLFMEGNVILFGRDISYEQFAESFAALTLSCAVAILAMREITPRPLPPAFA